MFLNSIRVPFLYAGNLALPAELKQAFPPDGSQSLRIGNISRTSDSNSSMVKFDLCSATEGVFGLKSGVVESKNWNFILNNKGYYGIVQSIMKTATLFHVLVCLHITEFIDVVALRQKLATAAKCNFYKIVKDSNAIIKLHPICHESANPERVFVLISISDINPKK